MEGPRVIENESFVVGEWKLTREQPAEEETEEE
jgi:hypothetical protein